MSTASPTFSQLKAQVAAIRQKVPQARVIGIRAAGAGPPSGSGRTASTRT